MKLSVVIYNQWSSGSWARVASMSIVFTGALLLTAIFGRRSMGRQKDQVEEEADGGL